MTLNMKTIGARMMAAMPDFGKMRSTAVKAYWGANVAVGTTMVITQLAGAATTGDDLFARLKSALQDVYTQALGLVTLIAALAALFALLIRMYSKDSRKVAEADDWLKRIGVSWFLIAILGTIFTWGGNITAGGGWGQDVSVTY